MLYVGPGCNSLIMTVVSYAASYHRCHIYLCPSLPKIAVVFLAESYEFVLERGVLMFLASITSDLNSMFRCIPSVCTYFKC